LCASVTHEFAAHLGQKLGVSLANATTATSVACLCASTISTFTATNAVARLATSLVGTNLVSNALENLIMELNPTQCFIPSHASSSCSPSNLCDFTCDKPLAKVGQKCLLGGSASPSARARKRHEQTLLRGAFRCRRDQMLCPVWSTSQIFECVSIKTDLYSCGGCTTGSGALGDEAPHHGVDCSDIPGVSDVSCLDGRCAVGKCMKGWRVNGTGNGCERT